MTTEAEVMEALSPAIAARRGLLVAFTNHMYSVSDAPLVYALNGALALASTFAPVGNDLGYGAGRWWGMNLGPTAMRKTEAVREVRIFVEKFDSARLFPNVQSIGALVEAAQLGDGRHLWLHEELGEFFGGSTAGQHREGLRNMLNNAYDGVPFSYATRKGSIGAKRPAITLLGGITVSHLQEHTLLHDWRSGFMNRWAIFMCPTKPDREFKIKPVARPCEGHVKWALEQYVRTAEKMGPCAGWEPDAERLWLDAMDIYWPAMALEPEWKREAMARTINTGQRAAMLYSMTSGAAYDGACQNPDQPWLLERDAAKFGLHVAKMHHDSMGTLLQKIASTEYEQHRMQVLDTFGDDGMKVLEFGTVMATVRPKKPRRAVNEILESLVLEGALYKTSGSGAGGTFYARFPLGQMEV